MSILQEQRKQPIQIADVLKKMDTERDEAYHTEDIVEIVNGVEVYSPQDPTFEQGEALGNLVVEQRLKLKKMHEDLVLDRDYNGLLDFYTAVMDDNYYRDGFLPLGEKLPVWKAFADPNVKAVFVTNDSTEKQVTFEKVTDKIEVDYMLLRVRTNKDDDIENGKGGDIEEQMIVREYRGYMDIDSTNRVNVYVRPSDRDSHFYDNLIIELNKRTAEAHSSANTTA